MPSSLTRTGSKAVESLLDRNRQLMTEVRELRAALDRVDAVLAHADKISASPSMTVYVAEVRAALRHA